MTGTGGQCSPGGGGRGGEGEGEGGLQETSHEVCIAIGQLSAWHFKALLDPFPMHRVTKGITPITSLSTDS